MQRGHIESPAVGFRTLCQTVSTSTPLIRGALYIGMAPGHLEEFDGNQSVRGST